MTEQRSRTVEEQEGIGRIYINNKPHQAVHYNITIIQEYWVGRNKKMNCMQSATGIISPVTGKLILKQGQIMVLHLKDGRIWKCCAKAGNPVLGWYQLVNANPLGVYRPRRSDFTANAAKEDPPRAQRNNY